MRIRTFKIENKYNLFGKRALLIYNNWIQYFNANTGNNKASVHNRDANVLPCTQSRSKRSQLQSKDKDSRFMGETLYEEIFHRSDEVSYKNWITTTRAYLSPPPHISVCLLITVITFYHHTIIYLNGLY